MELSEFRKEIEEVINKYSVENLSDTPDFILANYITDCLYVHETATMARDKWYGFDTKSGNRLKTLQDALGLDLAAEVHHPSSTTI